MSAQAQPTVEALEAAWRQGPPPPRGRGSVALICVRVAEGEHGTPERALVSTERGLEGDRWFDDPRRHVEAQLTLMNVRVAELVGGGRLPLHAAGDNVLVDLDLSEAALPPGARLRLGEALIEVSALPHTGCKKFRERFGLEALTWVNDRRHLRLRGMNCRVLAAGEVAVGDPVAVVAG